MRPPMFMLVLALGACAPQSDTATTRAQTATDAPTGVQPDDLRGRWNVSAIDGETLAMRIPLTGSATALVWQPSCAGQDIAFRMLGEDIVFYRPAGNAARTVCEIGYPEALPRVLAALEGRWTVSEQANGDLRLTRGARVMVLEKAPSEPQLSLIGEWRVAGLDGKDFNEPYGIALSGDDGAIWWEPRCAGMIVRYRIAGQRFESVEPSPAATPSPGEQASPPPAVCAIAVPERLPEVMTAIRAADRIARTPANGIRLSGNGRSVTLFSQ